jgi:Uma2 family endonuclease
MSAQPVTHMTAEEYLAAERAAEFRSEYYDGCVYAMAGTSFPHNLIVTNIMVALKLALKNRKFAVMAIDIRVRVSSGKAFTYPDIVALCGELQAADDQKDTLLNPALIVEVLSPSTELFDRGIKFAKYRELESLREYVLVSQTEPRLEKFARQPGGLWVLSEYVGIEAVCRFESVDCEIALADIYENVPLGGR